MFLGIIVTIHLYKERFQSREMQTFTPPSVTRPSEGERPALASCCAIPGCKWSLHVHCCKHDFNAVTTNPSSKHTQWWAVHVVLQRYHLIKKEFHCQIQCRQSSSINKMIPRTRYHTPRTASQGIWMIRNLRQKTTLCCPFAKDTWYLSQFHM